MLSLASRATIEMAMALRVFEPRCPYEWADDQPAAISPADKSASTMRSIFILHKHYAPRQSLKSDLEVPTGSSIGVDQAAREEVARSNQGVRRLRNQVQFKDEIRSQILG
jgi:hypothetical protein